MAINAIYQHHERSTLAATVTDLQNRELGIDGATGYVVGYSETLAAAFYIPSATGQLTANRVLYINSSGRLVNSANLTFDGTNATMGGTLGVTGLITASGGAEFSGGTAADGTIVYTATNGLQIRGKAGTSNDFRIAAAGGTVVARLPVGTANLNFDTRIDAAGGIAYTGGTAGAGRIVGSAVSGLIIRAQTGSARDLAIQAADGTNLIQIPVGAATLTLSAPVTVSGSNTLTVGGAATLSSTLGVTGMVTGNSSGASTPAFYASAATPNYGINRTGSGTNEKRWDITVTSTGLEIRSLTDAGASPLTSLVFTRGTGTAVTNIGYGNASTNPTHTFLGSGTVQFNTTSFLVWPGGSGSAIMSFGSGSGFTVNGVPTNIGHSFKLAARTTAGAGGTSGSPTVVDVTAHNVVAITPTSSSQYYRFDPSGDSQIIIVVNTTSHNYFVSDGAGGAWAVVAGVTSVNDRLATMLIRDGNRWYILDPHADPS